MKQLQLNFIFTMLVVALGSASAQSLKPEDPYPLQPGINKGTADSLVGTQYWYFYALPGNNRLTVRLSKAQALYGASIRNTTLTITLFDEKKTWRTTKVINPNPDASQTAFTAEKLKAKMKIIVSVAPPNQNLIRMGGEYEIEATGDVQFDEPKSKVDPIIRTFESKTGLNPYGTAKFLANGTIETTNGYRGTWKLFDRENRIYTVVMDDGFRVSVQYLSGFGLVRPDDPSAIVFQELRR